MQLGSHPNGRPWFAAGATVLFLLVVLAPEVVGIFDKDFDWKDRDHHLNVCVNTANCPAGMADSVKKAIDLWNSDSLTWRFKYVDSCTGADITIGCKNIEGLGSTKVNNGWNSSNTTSATITIDSDADWGYGNDDYEIVSTIVHELGHCARLDDTPKSDQSKNMRGAQGKAGTHRGLSAADSSEAASSDTASVITVDTVPKATPKQQVYTGIARPAEGSAPFNFLDAVFVTVHPFQPENLQIVGWTVLDNNTLQWSAIATGLWEPDMQLFYLTIGRPAGPPEIRQGVLYVTRPGWPIGTLPVVIAPPDTAVPSSESLVRLYWNRSFHPAGPAEDVMSFRWTLDGLEGIKGGPVVDVQLPEGDHVAVLEGRDHAGFTGVDTMLIHVGEAGGVPQDRGEVIKPSLFFATPARLGDRLSVGYELPVAGRVSLTVFDVQGRRVRALLAGQAMEEGTHVAAWDLKNDGGRPVSPGIYYLKLQLDGRVITRPLTLVP